MTWKYITAKCDCPNKIESWQATTTPDDVDSIAEGVTVIREAASDHVESSTYCIDAAITITITEETEIPYDN